MTGLKWLLEVQQLFERQNWNADLADEAERLVQTFCQMLSLLSEDERNLILHLSDEYLVVRCNRYPGLVTKLLNRVDPATIAASSQVYVIPIACPKDVQSHRTKSGNVICYLAKAFIPSMLPFAGKVMAVADSLISLESESKKDGRLLLFVDDFIGTSDTAFKFLDYYEEKCKAPTDKAVVLSLVVQNAGATQIEARGYPVISEFRRQKGISGSRILNVIPRALAIMDALEKRLNVSADYWRGYGNSEALVSMIRTPDNTFPVYWWTGQIDGKPWPAPFPAIH